MFLLGCWIDKEVETRNQDHSVCLNSGYCCLSGLSIKMLFVALSDKLSSKVCCHASYRPEITLTRDSKSSDGSYQGTFLHYQNIFQAIMILNPFWFNVKELVSECQWNWKSHPSLLWPLSSWDVWYFHSKQRHVGGEVWCLQWQQQSWWWGAICKLWHASKFSINFINWKLFIITKLHTKLKCVNLANKYG